MEQKVREKWQELYAVADKLIRLDPWKLGENVGFIKLPNSGQETPIVCTFWSYQKKMRTFGLSIVYTEQGMEFLQDLMAEEGDTLTNPVAAREGIAMMLESKFNVMPLNIEVVTECAISTYFDNLFLSFESYKYGRERWRLSLSEIEMMIDILTQLTVIVTEYPVNKITVRIDHGELLARNFNLESGAWELEAETNVIQARNYADFDCLVNDESVSDLLKKVPQTKLRMELANYFSIKTLKSDEEERGFHPEIVLAVNQKTGKTLIMAELDREKHSIDQIGQHLIDFMIKNGKPQSITVSTIKLKIFLISFCKALDIDLVCQQPLSKLPIVSTRFGSAAMLA